MKIVPLFVATVFGLTVCAGAEETVKISDVHLCCKGCVTGAEKAIGAVDGVTAAVDQASGTVTLTGSDAASVQKGATALMKAGYFGKSSDAHVKMDARTGAKGVKVQSLKVEGVHLCCAKCVKAVDQAIKSVSGVKEHTATKGAETFDVTGDFNDKELFTALQKEGLTGKVGK
jgi:periplasmic mercuric ion binding protein